MAPKYPAIKPPPCSTHSAPKITAPDCMTNAALRARDAAVISTVKIVAARGAVFLTASTWAGNFSFKTKPIRTGKSTTFSVEAKSASPFTGTVVPTRSDVSRGVVTTARMVELAVMSTDNATSPFARKVMRLEATPPGQQDTSMMPALVAGANGSRVEARRPREGMRVYCRKTPVVGVDTCLVL